MSESQLRFRADPRHIRHCRRWAVTRAAEHGASAQSVQVLELLTSEVVTNAVTHGPPGGEVTVRLERQGDDILLDVSDSSAGTPVVREPHATRPGGRGMSLVQLLSRDWGVRQHAAEGKSVWFRLPLDTGLPAVGLAG